MAELNTSKTEWDLSPLLASDDDPKIEEYRQKIQEATEAFEKKWRNRTDYLEDPLALKEALDELEDFEKMPGNGNEAYYFARRSSQDSINPEIKAKANKAIEFSQKIGIALQFFWLNVGKIDEATQKIFLAKHELAPYRHVLDRTFADGKYRLSEAEEKILALKSQPAQALWVKMTSDLLSREERETLKEDGLTTAATMEEILSLISSKNKDVRDKAAEKFNDILKSNVDIAEVEINAVLGNKKIDDELRGYDRPDKPRHIADDIETEVVDALIKAVTDRFDIPRRFYGLKAKLLGLPILKYHERNIEYGSIEKEYDYNEASQLIYEVLSGLDIEFGEIFKTLVENGNIDVFPRKGKTGGAYCSGSHITHPTYVLLNHTNKLRDVMTIAHEMGHAINNELMKKSQNALNYDTPLSTAEVASTFMEDFVIERLVEDVGDELRLSLMMSQLNDIVSSIPRQVAFYNFETDLHQAYRDSGYVSKEAVGKLFQKHTGSYLGDVVEQSPGSENWWVYVGHFRWFFYVYSYANGLLISKALQAKVRKDKSFIRKVKKLLSTGTSKSPKDIFAEMGIDITDAKFWHEGLDEIEALLNETEALAKKLGKI
jgi:oligoendopeptidase F